MCPLRRGAGNKFVQEERVTCVGINTTSDQIVVHAEVTKKNKHTIHVGFTRSSSTLNFDCTCAIGSMEGHYICSHAAAVMIAWSMCSFSGPTPEDSTVRFDFKPVCNLIDAASDDEATAVTVAASAAANLATRASAPPPSAATPAPTPTRSQPELNNVLVKELHELIGSNWPHIVEWESGKTMKFSNLASIMEHFRSLVCDDREDDEVKQRSEANIAAFLNALGLHCRLVACDDPPTTPDADD